MKRFLITFAASALAFVAVVGGTAFLFVNNVVGPRLAEAAGAPAWAAQIPAEIRDLHDLPPAERFNHFLGAQLQFTDANNAAHTVQVTPGTVASIGTDELTIASNDNGGNKTFKLTSDTRVHTAGQPWAGAQDSQTTLKSGDKVVVVTLDGSTEAKAVMVSGPEGFRPGGPFHRRG